MDLSIFKEKSIIICPNEKKKELLKLFSKDLSFNAKFLTKENVINSLTYSFDDKAILYLEDKGYSFSNALEIFDNLKFITNGSNKLNKLLQIKEELNENKLLVYNPHFSNLFKGKKTYIYGYSSLDKELSLVLEKNGIEHLYIEEELKDYSHTVSIYENLEDEVSSFFNNVCLLIEQGTSIDDNVEFAPALVLYNKGEVVDFLDSTSDEDKPALTSVAGLKKWLEEYIYLSK